MAYVITDTCKKDDLCIDSCPSDAIHPTKDEPAHETVTQLFINPAECIDCAACVAECPSDSIHEVEALPADKADAVAKNAEFYNQ